MHVCIKVLAKCQYSTVLKLDIYMYDLKTCDMQVLQAIHNLYYKCSFTEGLMCLLALDCAKLLLLVFFSEFL